jgi:hypothetical protein
MPENFSRGEYEVPLPRDFATLLSRCFQELNPKAQFHWIWHIDVMAAKLDAVRKGEIKRLIINVPRDISSRSAPQLPCRLGAWATSLSSPCSGRNRRAARTGCMSSSSTAIASMPASTVAMPGC